MTTPNGQDKFRTEQGIAAQIFAASATLVGVCLTVLGIFRLTTRLQAVGRLGNMLLAIDALVFLVSCLLSYLAMRTTGTPHKRRVEQVADAVFLLGLALMVVVCGLIAYEYV